MSKPSSWRASKTFIILVVCVGVFTDNLAYGILIPSLPVILTRYSHVHEEDVQYWTSSLLTSFGIAYFFASPILGFFSDQSANRRSTFLAGLAAMMLGLVLLAAFSASPVMMSFARACQGFSSAAVGVAGLALIVDAVGKDKAATGLSYMGLSVNLSMAAAPVLGGVVFDKFGYYAVFAIPLPLLAVDIILRILVIEKPSISKRPLEPTEYTPLLSTPKQQNCKISSPTFHLLSQPRLLSAAFVLILSVTVLAAFETTLPLFCLHRFGWHPSTTGFLFLGCVLPKALGPFAGHLVDKYGACVPTTVATIVGAGSLFSLRLVQSNTAEDQMTLVLLMIVYNVAAAFIEVGMMSEIGIVAAEVEQSLSESADNGSVMGQGGALVNVSFACGLMLGPVIGGLAFQQMGWNGLTIATGLAVLIGLPGTIIFAGHRVSKTLET